MAEGESGDSGWATAVANAPPHPPQNLTSGWFTKPHDGQPLGRADPHSPQKRRSSVFSALQAGRSCKPPLGAGSLPKIVREGRRKEVYTDILQMTSETVEFVPPFHRQGNGIPSATIRWPDFGDRPTLGRHKTKSARNPARGREGVLLRSFPGHYCMRENSTCTSAIHERLSFPVERRSHNKSDIVMLGLPAKTHTYLSIIGDQLGRVTSPSWCAPNVEAVAGLGFHRR